MNAREIVGSLVYLNYSVQRDLGATYRQCAHPLAFGGAAVGLEERYLEARNEGTGRCQGIPGRECDEPECPICYPPAAEFEPAELPASGAAEPDDYFD
jgi:hypothetical protein